jgi:aminoglycoside phosphotransferase (APT) family kinase protein
VDVRRPSGAVVELVLRRFVRSDWLAEEPDAVLREAAALRAVRAVAGVPTPALVAVRPELPVPALLMTRLGGVVDWDPPLARLAELARALHTASVEADGVPPYDPWELRLDGPPGFARDAGVWRAAIEVFRGVPPAASGPPCLIHRDFHPGNVLWSRGEVTGLVDWASASVGDPFADVGHCRVNLVAAHGLEAADAFLESYGVDGYSGYWDVVAALGGLGEDDLLDHWGARLEELLARAVARV